MEKGKGMANVKNKEINILGTVYKVMIDVDPDEMPEDADGCMDHSIRTIKVAKFESDRNSLKNLKSYRNRVLRHEIIHAFLYESGLWNNSGNIMSWAMSEEITDWIAIQSPKIFDVFKQVGCL